MYDFNLQRTNTFRHTAYAASDLIELDFYFSPSRTTEINFNMLK